MFDFLHNKLAFSGYFIQRPEEMIGAIQTDFHGGSDFAIKNGQNKVPRVEHGGFSIL